MTTRIEMGGEHEFSIKAELHDFSRTPSLKDLEVEWEVRLPHQCDQWSITGHATSKAAAVARLETFIGEAQAALEQLRALPEDAHALDILSTQDVRKQHED